MRQLCLLIYSLLFTSVLLGAPIVTNLDPNFGPAAGGNLVTILGSGFTGASAVNFGSQPAAFIVIDDSTIQAVAPLQIPTTVPVVVEVGSEASPTTCDTIYTYQGDWVAYFTNNSTTTAIDTSTNTLIATIPIADLPSDVAISPDGTRAYVISRDVQTGTGNLFVIDTATNTIIDTIFLATLPRGIAITPDGTRAYIANQTNSLTVVDLTTNTVLTTISTTGSFFSVAITPDGTKAYFASQSPPHITVVDTATNTVITTISAPLGPLKIAITPDGTRAYVSIANIGASALVVIDIATDTILTTINASQFVLAGVAITPDGSRVYVASLLTDEVAVFDTATNTLITTIALPAGNFPIEIAITPDGARAYVTGILGNFFVIDTATNTLIATRPVGDTGTSAVAITPDQAPAASFHVTIGSSGEETIFDASTSRSPVGQIIRYDWDFGNGQTATTSSPIISHVYEQAGSYTVTLTVTNSAGTSTTQVFTGQTVSRQGGPSAVCTQVITIPFPPPLPPSNLKGKCIKNKFATQTEYVHQLKWTASPDPRTVGYRIYRNGKLIATVGKREHLFNDHNRKKDKRDTYVLVAISVEGFESTPLTVTVPNRNCHSCSY